MKMPQTQPNQPEEVRFSQKAEREKYAKNRNRFTVTK